ncbi:MAG TPA: hypothetical protein VIK34_05855 [Clostridiaceae bacterium]
MSIEEINEAIDKEIEFIGLKNQESVKGMMRIKTVLNKAEGLKHCLCCNGWLTPDNFSKNKSAPDGLCFYCKVCNHEQDIRRTRI